MQWVVNGRMKLDQEFTFPPDFESGPGAVNRAWVFVSAEPQALERGDHRVKIVVGGRELLNDVFRVG